MLENEARIAQEEKENEKAELAAGNTGVLESGKKQEDAMANMLVGKAVIKETKKAPAESTDNQESCCTVF